MRSQGAASALCLAIALSAKPSRTYGRHSKTFWISLASTWGDCFLPFLLGIVRVSKRETMGWLVKPITGDVVCLESRQSAAQIVHSIN